MSQIDVFNSIQEKEEDTLEGKYLIFSMGDEMFGMEIRYITEIISLQPITEIPEMPDYIKGVMNLRGKVIPIMDARMRFHKPVIDSEKTCIIVLDASGVNIGMIVDSVAEVIPLEDKDIAPPPEITAEHKYIKGIAKVGGNKLLLDCQRLLTDEEADLIGNLSDKA